MRNALIGVVLLALAGVQIIALGKAAEEKKLIAQGVEDSYVLPSPVLKLSALEFDGLASDFLFLKSLVFVGSTFEKAEHSYTLTSPEAAWLYHALDASACLDPYFLDPYYFSNANLTWGVGMIRETNALLEKGVRYRDWDSLLPFFVGFNYFYFLQENEKAGEYLMIASHRSGHNPLYGDLAVKLAYKENRTETAIAFLRQILEKTEDKRLRKEYETRLSALDVRLFLERAAASYRVKFGKAPVDPDALVKKGIIGAVPKDPYGGRFYLDSAGAVRSTSDQMLMPHQKK